MSGQENSRTSGNPIISHKYTCDPTAIVYQDRLYVYTGHDEAPVGVEDYLMKQWLCFSSPDLLHWQEHPSPLKATDFAWAKGDAYASKVIYTTTGFTSMYRLARRALAAKRSV